MRRWKKGILAAVLCAALALGIALPAFGASGTVYLMAVNEKVLDTTVENIPTVMGGVLYVPYTMLSIRDSGINLGVSALYSTTRRTVLVSNGQSGVVFDTQTNTAQDIQGNSVSARAMVRNSMVFLPIDWLCSYFGTISCSRIRTPYGTLIRVTNGAVVLRDLDFVDAASNQLEEKQRAYLNSIAPPETSAPATAPPTAPPTPSRVPVPVESEPPLPLRAEVLLALRWGEQSETMTALLESRGERVLLLFPWDGLKERDEEIRRAVAAGHTVGLLLTGESPEDGLIQAAEGRRLLAELARYPVLVVSAPKLDKSGRTELAQAGYVLWTADLLGESFRSGRALTERLDPDQPNRVELNCGPGSGAFLEGLLSALDGEECSLRQASAPALSSGQAP